MESTKLTQKAKDILAKTEREFDPKVTRGQLLTEQMVVGSWGARNWKGIEEKALLFEVNGAIHKGVVLITLGWEDLYKVYLLDYELNVLSEPKAGIYADDLVWVIDRLVETPE